MDALMDINDAYKHVGKALLDEYFSGEKLRLHETKWWEGDRTEYEILRSDKRPGSFQGTPGAGSKAFVARDQYRTQIEQSEAMEKNSAEEQAELIRRLLGGDSSD
jgi:hypothetical protein